MAKSIRRYLADISSTSGVLDGTLSTAAQSNITSLGTLSSLTVSGSAAMTLTTAAQPNITSLGTLTNLVVDDITINGSTISDAADFVIDAGGDITLDADGGDVFIDDGGTRLLSISNAGSNNVQISTSISDGDLLFKGNDGGSTITALTLDMSDAGKATFNSGIVSTGALIRAASSGATADASADDLIVENSANAGISILSGASNTGSIYFGDSGTNWDGYIAYSQNDRQMTLGTAAGTRVTITSAGYVGIGDATPQASLDVGGGYGANTTVATFAHATDAYVEIENMTTQNGAGIILTNAGTKKWTIQKDTSAHHLTIQDANSDNIMTFLQGGNVGMNELTPTSYYSTTFQINGSGNTSAIKMTNTSTGNANNRGHDFASDGADIRIVNREANGHVQLYTCAVTDSTILALDAMEDGQVRFPKQAAFEASGAGTWTSDLSTAWHGLIDTERHDANGDFDNTNGRFTAPHDGYYILTMSVYAQKNTTTASGGYVHPGIFINGAYTWMGGNTPYTIFGNAASNHSVTGYPDGITVTRTIHMSSGDYAEAKLYVNGTFRIYENYNYFAGGYLGG